MPSFRRLLARALDVSAIVDLIDKASGEGYGPSSATAAVPILSRLLEEGAACGTLLVEGSREASDTGRTLRAVAITGFVELERGRAWVATPPNHFIDHVFERERALEPILLRPARIGSENATNGMALVFLAFALDADLTDPSVGKHISLMQEGFRLFHEGYHCPLALHPAARSPTGRETLIGMSFQPAGDGQSVWFLDRTTLAGTPYHPLSVVLRAFPPRLAFTPSEREMLFRAVLGYADAEIAGELHVSVETVRKRWRTVFQRVMARSELQIFPQTREDSSETTRGPEKRGALLQYLTSHLEELRPYSVPRGGDRHE